MRRADGDTDMIDHQTGFVASTVGDRALLALGAHADLSISRVSISRVSISRANIQVVTQSSVLADPLRMADPRRRLLAGLTRRRGARASVRTAAIRFLLLAVVHTR